MVIGAMVSDHVCRTAWWRWPLAVLAARWDGRVGFVGMYPDILRPQWAAATGSGEGSRPMPRYNNTSCFSAGGGASGCSRRSAMP